EFGKQGLDLIAVSPRARVGRRAGEGADRLARRLLPVHEEFSKGTRRASFLLGTPAALAHCGAIDGAVRGRVCAPIAQRLARGAVVGVLFRRIPKLLSREPAAGLVTAINDWDVRLNATREEPRQELAAGVGFVSSQALRVQAQRLDLLQHPPRRQ